ncbi:hypothetical protein, partial [Paraburkholderia aspalathi]|uniref:hypothetical protein n=1 Tax=Paraburkholderia aspalathi TaxID=1324617 RepID=UPI001BAA1268
TRFGSLSLCDVFGCDLKFGLPQSKSRDLRRDRFRQFQWPAVLTQSGPKPEACYRVLSTAGRSPHRKKS